MGHVIKNFDTLAGTESRRLALEIIEAGLDAINTDKVVKDAVKISNGTLQIGNVTEDLAKFKRIRVIGFGKASCDAAVALHEVLGDKISGGAVIDLKTAQCGSIETLVGTHPHPSSQNVVATRQIVELAKDTNEDDLVIAIVSGGGSALLCWPEEECTQGDTLYTEFLKVGADINELNTVRKHLSLLKGGGLAKLFYPARIISLIFCDIPGGDAKKVASGPTFKDDTSISEAQAILDKYNISGISLNETPKEDRYFEKVSNISMVSNVDALEAMKNKSEELGLSAKILSTEVYDEIDVALDKFKQEAEETNVVLSGGEVKLVVEKGGGSGGRNVQLALAALEKVGGDTFVAIASDGIDNCEAAGAVADAEALENARKLDLDIGDYLKRCDSYNFFKQTGDIIMTGQTGSNVSDLMLWLRR